MATNPTKEQVRHWQEDRVKEHKPPPDPAQIRRELGWELLEAEREQQKQDRREPC